MHKLGYTQSKNDYSLFIQRSDTHIIIVAVYVDDIIVTGSDEVTIASFKHHLHQTFSIKDLGLLNFFLGIEVSHLPHGVLMTQKKFTRELLQDCPLSLSFSAKTPLPSTLKLHADVGDAYSDPELSWCFVGKLNFLSNTRPDLAYAVQALSQFMHHPLLPHVKAPIMC